MRLLTPHSLSQLAETVGRAPQCEFGAERLTGSPSSSTAASSSAGDNFAFIPG
ncbi:hypothetical protein FRUB_09298 [Fimbriiglobus ruber]|uniref:Uncharacterized protein n=1 Tax=Fimbriiglobus ruber TaxID=1908690 RepID=A0A225DK20_9BACT|nr:hypothetical protein FRUB_09298 [Fimbriiglobus ruber]